jgi:Co/Zn/Cd efflux system component
MVAKIALLIAFFLLVIAAKLLRRMWKEMKDQQRELRNLDDMMSQVGKENRVLRAQRDSWKAQFLKADEDLKYLQNWKL